MDDPNKLIPPFMGNTVFEHVIHSMLVLRLQGLMSDGERDKICARLDKAMLKYNAKKDTK